MRNKQLLSTTCVRNLVYRNQMETFQEDLEGESLRKKHQQFGLQLKLTLMQNQSCAALATLSPGESLEMLYCNEARNWSSKTKKP